jgi:acyl carrier protein
VDNLYIIKEFIVREFMPDVQAEQLDDDYDLIASGVIDSLSLLRVIAWLENQFFLPIDDMEIAEKNFSSVTAINEFINSTSAEKVPS